jgi:DNA-binding NarL/FixJ family response regulator
MPASATRSDPISVFLVEDHPAILEAVTCQVKETPDAEVCGTTGSRMEAFRQIERHQPDVVVVDISLEDGHGLDLIQNVQAQHPEIQMIVFSMYDESVYAERALQAGASGYLMKTEPPEELISGIRAVSEGEVYLSDEMSSRVVGKAVWGEDAESRLPIDELTDRELAVFQMLGEGYNLREIQDRLNIARKTVESYRRRAKEKLGFDSVAELLQFAVKWVAAPEESAEDLRGGLENAVGDGN